MTSKLSAQIHEQYVIVCEKIEKSIAASGRAPDAVKLVVVSKTQPIDTVIAALEAGIRNLGENYTEEAVEKIVAVGSVPDLTWHMIGHVQSRKASLVAQYFDYVHSVDSLKVANRLDRFAQENNRKLQVLLECNVSAEESKSGFQVFNETARELFFVNVQSMANLANLEICGLMTMPPLWENPEKNRPYFRHLRELKDQLSNLVPNVNWKNLSMGTSADFVVAIEEGATMVRIGTAIFGSRLP